MSTVSIPADLMREIAAYLAGRPFREVVGFMMALEHAAKAADVQAPEAPSGD